MPPARVMLRSRIRPFGYPFRPLRAKRTSMTGRVTFTVRPTKALKLKKGGRVNIFVRASTPGQPITGGTSTRRLVSFRTAAAR